MKRVIDCYGTIQVDTSGKCPVCRSTVLEIGEVEPHGNYDAYRFCCNKCKQSFLEIWNGKEHISTTYLPRRRI